MAAEDPHRRPLTAPPAIAIVGAGPVAQTLGRALLARGARVIALASRDPARAQRAAAFIGASVQALDLHSLPAEATTVLIAVSDDAIEPVAEALAPRLPAGTALHTCGARGPETLAALARHGVACGVLHPLQSIPVPEPLLQPIAFGVAGDARALAVAERLARLMGGQPLRIAPGSFPLYHAAAVMASNHLVALVAAAVALFEQAGVPPQDALDALAPLCRTTPGNVLSRGPVQVLTGPVARGDAGTVRAHLDALGGSPADVRELYCAASRLLVDLAQRRGLGPDAVERLRAVLDR